MKKNKMILFVPIDRIYPLMTPIKKFRSRNKLYAVEYDSWDEDSAFAYVKNCKAVSILTAEGFNTVQEQRHDISERDFEDEIDVDLDDSDVEDLTDLVTVAIDPETAKDFDDAISCSYNADSECYDVYVHIADVSAYVKKDSPLDAHALEQCVTYYLIGKSYPMLPR